MRIASPYVLVVLDLWPKTPAMSSEGDGLQIVTKAPGGNGQA